MKVGIDARLFGQTGVGVYIKNLLYQLNRLKNPGFIFYVYFLAEDIDKINLNTRLFKKKVVYERWHTLSEQFSFWQRLYQDKLDLMHFTYFSYPVFYKRRFISTLHDTTPLNFKTFKASTRNQLVYVLKHQVLKYVISQQVQNAKIIITPSFTVKDQLVKIYGNKYRDKIRPIYEGVDYELIQSSVSYPGFVSGSDMRFRNKFGMTKRDHFFIYVGNFYPHKNVENLLKASARDETSVNLILIGPDDYFASRLTRLINQCKQENRIFIYHEPKKQDLVFFYKNALGLIHPSMSEGFGLPLLEAAYFNLPIIASRIDIFTEILADKAVYFDPKNINEMSEKIDYFLKKKPKFDYQGLKVKFSFAKMTKAILNQYRKGVGLNHRQSY